MHIGKKHNIDKCGDVSVDAWAETFSTSATHTEIYKDTHMGKEQMKNVKEKKYLGDLISSDLKNEKNIKERVGKATGKVNIIVRTLTKIPFENTSSKLQS